MNFMLCCHAKHPWESQLCYIPITVFFLHHPAPVTTGNYLLVQEKYFWDVTKVQLKAFSKYHNNPISVFVIINLELYGLMCLP